ncbi:MAG: hypothetical protein V3T70_08285 [Phycisphaerae bacterium]
MNHSNMYKRRCERRAVTLIEGVIASVIVGVMLVASLEALQTVAVNEQIATSEPRAQELAKQLLGEILDGSYAEPDADAGQTLESDVDGDGDLADANESKSLLLLADAEVFGAEATETGGTRNYFDDIDDYNNLVETSLMDKDGTSIPNTTGWTRQVSVTYADPTTLAPAGTSVDTGVKLIRVTVTDPDGRQTTLSALHSRFDLPDRQPGTDTTYIRAIGLTLQIGADPSAAVTGATTLLNQPEEVTPIGVKTLPGFAVSEI